MQVIRFYHSENKVKRFLWSLFEMFAPTKQDEEEYRQYVEEQENLIEIPTHCPECKSTNIIGRGAVIGYAYVNLETLQVDEPGDDFEVCNWENLEFTCWDCHNNWENISNA